METNIPIEQAIVQSTNKKNNSSKKNYKLAKLDNGPMLSTSEILDFASGVDSTESD